MKSMRAPGPSLAWKRPSFRCGLPPEVCSRSLVFGLSPPVQDRSRGADDRALRADVFLLLRGFRKGDTHCHIPIVFQADLGVEAPATVCLLPGWFDGVRHFFMGLPQ